MAEMSAVKGLGNLPTTIEAALQPCNVARIITEPDEPFRIVHVNEIWCRTCGYDAEEVLGQTCKFLHGPGTCGMTLSMLKQALQQKRGLAVQLLNYTKAGRPFTNTLQVAPLYDQAGKVTHYLGVVMARYLDAPPTGAATGQSAAELQGRGGAQGLAQGAGQGLSGGAGGPLSGPVKSLGSPGGPLSIHGAGGSFGGGFGGYGECSSAGFEAAHAIADELAEQHSPHGISRVPPFLTKLTEILTVENAEIVTLNANTPSFTICDAQRFAKEVLPRYFKHNKLGSFYQQLHTYGFRRSGSGPDASVEFYHEQYSGSAAEFAEWIRQGGAVSKRTVPLRGSHLSGGPHGGPIGAPTAGLVMPEPTSSSATPPPQLLHDMLQVHEGMRQLAHHFNQQKAQHSLQLRSILSKLTMRGLLAPESAAYIGALPPTTPLGAGGPPTAPTGPAGLAVGQMSGLSSATAAAVAAATASAMQSSGGSNSMDLSGFLSHSGMMAGRAAHDSLQAQLDALEAGLLAPMGNESGNMPTGTGSVDGTGLPVDGSRSLDSNAMDICYARESFKDDPCGGSGPSTTPPRDLQGDEALNLFADSSVGFDNRQPQPYPVGVGKPAAAPLSFSG